MPQWSLLEEAFFRFKFGSIKLGELYKLRGVFSELSGINLFRHRGILVDTQHPNVRFKIEFKP